MRARSLVKLSRADRGSALVETALAFPLLLLLVLGLLEFGLLIYTYNTVKHSALVGLRKATVLRTSTEQSVVDAVRASAHGLQLGDSAILVQVAGGAKTFEGRAYGDSLEVRVTHRYTPVLSRIIPELDVPIRTSARGMMW